MRKTILEHLQQNPSGAKRADLRIFLANNGILITDRKLRKEVEEMIKDGELIQSSCYGYSLISNSNQLNEAIEYLNKKASAIAIRKNFLIKNFIKKYSKNEKQQLILEL